MPWLLVLIAYIAWGIFWGWFLGDDDLVDSIAIGVIWPVICISLIILILRRD